MMRRNAHHWHRGSLVRSFVPLLGACHILAAAALSGCATAPRPLFEPLADPIVWPGPPDPARIQYLGEFRTEADLRPGRSFGEAISAIVFGRREIRSMLTPLAITGDHDPIRGTAPMRIFVCDSNAQVVHIFNLDSRRYEQWRADPAHGAFAQPVGLAYDHLQRRLLITDAVAGGIYIFDDAGRGLGWVGEPHLQRPTGIAVDALRERIYIADTAAHQIVVLDHAGNLLQTIGERGSHPGAFNFPTNIAVHPDGRIFVSDSLNFRIQVFDVKYRHLGQIGQRGNRPGHFSQPRGIALDRHGHIHVVDAHFEAVQIFDAEGRLLLSFGEEGRNPGQFWLPTGIYIAPDDRIWVTDSYNRRVQVFEYLDAAAPAPESPEVHADLDTRKDVP